MNRIKVKHNIKIEVLSIFKNSFTNILKQKIKICGEGRNYCTIYYGMVLKGEQFLDEYEVYNFQDKLNSEFSEYNIEVEDNYDGTLSVMFMNSVKNKAYNER